MMMVLGLSLGAYYLTEKEGLSNPSGIQAVMWTRVFVVAGLVIGGTATASAYGFEVAALCTSTLSMFVPWAVYWTGLILAAGLLIATYRLGAGSVRSTT